MSVAVLVVAALLGACGGSPRTAESAPQRVEGLRATVIRAARGDTWDARWRVCWRPVAAARAYAVSVLTSEGAGRSRLRVAGRCWSLTVATGAPTRRRLERQIALVAPSLSVQVAAVSAAGRRGPPSRPVAVGDVVR